jgi:hypothetical protein
VRLVSNLDGPEVKGRARSLEKMANDYGGHAKYLKDLARARESLGFADCSALVEMLVALQKDVKVVSLKNKFGTPTPLGYRDLNLVVELPRLATSGHPDLYELQMNLRSVMAAKTAAHVHYETVRSALPAICRRAGGTPEQAGELEAFLVGRLCNSASAAAVAVMVRAARARPHTPAPRTRAPPARATSRSARRPARRSIARAG